MRLTRVERWRELRNARCGRAEHAETDAGHELRRTFSERRHLRHQTEQQHDYLPPTILAHCPVTDPSPTFCEKDVRGRC